MTFHYLLPLKTNSGSYAFGIISGRDSRQKQLVSSGLWAFWL